MVRKACSEVAFCVVNATIGLRSVSPTLASHSQIVRDSGILYGAYHWSQTVNQSATTADKSDPIGEATHFLATVQPRPGDILALDHEEALGTWEQRVAYALAWCNEVKARTGAIPLVYVNWFWVSGLRAAATIGQWERLVAYPCWLADPSGTGGQHEPIDPKPGSSKGWPVAVHQYATTDNLDRNWTPDLAALRALGVK